MLVSRRYLGVFLLLAPLSVCALPAGAERTPVVFDVPAFFGKSPQLLVRKFGKPGPDPYGMGAQVFRKPGIEISATVENGKVREMVITLAKPARMPSQQWVRRFNLRLPPGLNGAKDDEAPFTEWHTPLPYRAIKQIKARGDGKGWQELIVSDKYEPLAG